MDFVRRGELVWLACEGSPSAPDASARCYRLRINPNWWDRLGSENAATYGIAPEGIFMPSNGDLVALVAQLKRKFWLLRAISIWFDLYTWPSGLNHFASCQFCHLQHPNQGRVVRHPHRSQLPKDMAL